MTGMRLGRDITLDGLEREGYEAVFLGIGAQEAVRLGIPGEDAAGVVDALAFLRQYNLRGSVPVGKEVVVVGGGNAAIDAARTAIRLGAESVTIVYRRTREEMPAYAEEIEEAEHEGVELEAAHRARGDRRRRTARSTGLKCQPMTLGAFDRIGTAPARAVEGDRVRDRRATRSSRPSARCRAKGMLDGTARI